MRIIIRPIITEKSLGLVNLENQYTFEVDARANKVEIAKEVAKQFKVEVESVKILNKLGRRVNFGKMRLSGKKKNVKKAIVRLAKGSNISDFNIN